MTSNIRVRIAPSPTGSVHLGLCRTALFNWALARKLGGEFILRIEDTDHGRNTQESEKAILDGLAWLGFDWDEGPDKGGPHVPYHQSQRVARHLEMAQTLLESGHAYRDFSTPEALDAWRAEQESRKQRVAYRGADRELSAADSKARADAGEPFAIRFRILEGNTTFTDMIRDQVTIPHAEIDDWVMVRRGGEAPTYNFVVVCDDVDMRITHVLRGEEHLVNTPKQLLVYDAFGHDRPEFAHLPLMLGTDRKKLSKRTGDTSLGDYQAKGYPRDAIFNFLALQGWALDGEHDVFDRETMVKNFDVASISKGGAIFDPAKFLWMAGEYLRAESPEQLAENVTPFAVQAGLMGVSEIEQRKPWFLRLVASVQDRMQLYSQFPDWAGHFFVGDGEIEYDPKAEKGARKRDGRVETLLDYAKAVEAGEVSGAASAMADASKAWVEARGAKIPDLFQPLRCALTGMAGGPDLFETMDLLGSDASLARIRAGAERLA